MEIKKTAPVKDGGLQHFTISLNQFEVLDLIYAVGMVSDPASAEQTKSLARMRSVLLTVAY